MNVPKQFSAPNTEQHQRDGAGESGLNVAPSTSSEPPLMSSVGSSTEGIPNDGARVLRLMPLILMPPRPSVVTVWLVVTSTVTGYDLLNEPNGVLTLTVPATTNAESAAPGTPCR